jgi:hypothetical protein
MGQVVQFRPRVSPPFTFDLAHAALQLNIAVLLLAVEMARMQLMLLSEALERSSAAARSC